MYFTCSAHKLASLADKVYDAVDRIGQYKDLLGSHWFVALAERLVAQANVEGIVAYLVDIGRCVNLIGNIGQLDMLSHVPRSLVHPAFHLVEA
jgi:hypothetical protein